MVHKRLSMLHKASGFSTRLGQYRIITTLIDFSWPQKVVSCRSGLPCKKTSKYDWYRKVLIPITSGPCSLENVGRPGSAGPPQLSCSWARYLIIPAHRNFNQLDESRRMTWNSKRNFCVIWVNYYFGFWHITSRMQAGGLLNDDRLFSNCKPSGHRFVEPELDP